MDRRQFLQHSALLLAASGAGRAVAAPPTADPLSLRAGPLLRRFRGIDAPTEVWGYNASLPGPTLRLRQGARLRATLENQLPEVTTLHWHGMRVPHAMDGVPGITQPPVAPGQRFDYEFVARDAGTYWYHPHHRSHEQIGRGLAGAVIVEEAQAPEVDQDLVWLLADFKLDPRTGAHAPFDVIAEHAESGRLGNVFTINGELAGADFDFPVQSGQRVRLRLINAATARVFQLRFAQHAPLQIAFDGQAVPPHAPSEGQIALAPGQRVDLILDCAAAPESRHLVSDAASGRSLATMRYLPLPALAHDRFKAPLRLARNELPTLNLKKPSEHTIEFKGGDSGPPIIGMVDGKPVPYKDMRERHKLAWTLNSESLAEDAKTITPLLVAKRGSTQVLNLVNSTGFIHPMHLHGNFMRVLSQNGVRRPFEEWRDTVALQPFDEIQVAFVAEEPGDWVFHCHLLEHAAAGMVGVFRIE